MAADQQTGKFTFVPPIASTDVAMPPIRLGNAEIRQVAEIGFKLPISLLTQDQALLDANADWLRPRFLDDDGNWDMIVQSWLLIVEGKVILIDPCTGDGRHNPALPMQHMLDTPYIDRFAASGFRPEDVDYVFCTHLHGDHCGWNTVLRDGRYVPTFPRARYVMVQREFDRWDTRRPDHQRVEANQGVFENSVLPVLEAGLADIVPDKHFIAHGVLVEPAYGHTAGHSMLSVHSHGADALFVGDAFHHALEVRYPELDMGACEDFKQGLATRRRIIKRCIDDHALFVPGHFPAPHVGWIRSAGGETVFEPYGCA
jgi:glyoxylase-like metal-dependent hydrolase (beta-lactamase superfamily II)